MIESCPGHEIGVLTSGGLDSSVLAGLLAQQGKILHPLYIRAGLLWEDVEIKWLQNFLTNLVHFKIRPLKELVLPVQDLYGLHWSLTGENFPDYDSPDETVYLPGRNLLLLSKAALYCASMKIEYLALGLLKGNPFSDSTLEFLNSFEKSASLALNFPFHLYAPFRCFSKEEIISLGCQLPLELTFSCIHPKEGYHCGSCNKCAERQHAFSTAGVLDRTVYI